jgi:signal transduction histidine kinase
VSALREADTKGLFRTELELHRKDGTELPASVAVTPMVGVRQLGYLCVIRDLTAEREAEEALRRMQVRLAHHEKIAALGRVAAQVAHEVRNPLTGLLLFAAHLKNKLADKAGEEELRLVDRIIETINHLSNTVNQITSFARPLRLEFREVDLNEVVANVLQLLEPQIAAGRAEKCLRLHDGELRARADESSLRSALTNLILNAVQAMRGGGRLTVATGRDAGSLVVEIEDTGVGMSEEQLRNVFEAFYTTKTHGLGLGMPYAKKVVEEHGGRIHIESRAGEGTTVRVHLPDAPREG